MNYHGDFEKTFIFRIDIKNHWTPVSGIFRKYYEIHIKLKAIFDFMT